MRQTVVILSCIFLLPACNPTGKQKIANTVAERRESLRQKQENALRAAQLELAKTDSLLQQTEGEFSQLQTKVEKDKAALCATPEELTALTKTRMRRDSLRTECEVLGAKIRYIRQKQMEMKRK